MKIAKVVRDCSKDFNGTARLYELSEPITYEVYESDGLKTKQTCFIILSSISSFLMGEETMAFPATQDGRLISWNDLGSISSYNAFDELLKELGYEVEG